MEIAADGLLRHCSFVRSTCRNAFYPRHSIQSALPLAFVVRSARNNELEFQ
jgi:hypothetical protein